VRMTHRLIITNICAKLFQIPLINDKVMDRTRKCDGRTDGRSLLLYPPFFFEKAGDNEHIVGFPPFYNYNFDSGKKFLLKFYPWFSIWHLIVALECGFFFSGL
jgi:hypothetical protein